MKYSAAFFASNFYSLKLLLRKLALVCYPLMKLHSLNDHRYMLAMSLQKFLARKAVECFIAYKETHNT
ncbi:hypothetical protein H5410_025846 [Solanum commersonii]|uniref:Uncharacterized protein n=1 Tax=Solanum commersonii TaxID=4109 RepID=A0A9J5YVC4_SOLCO|nr:hypothetical protein H5410_025846 [Solanum commersonii]